MVMIFLKWDLAILPYLALISYPSLLSTETMNTIPLCANCSYYNINDHE